MAYHTMYRKQDTNPCCYVAHGIVSTICKIRDIIYNVAAMEKLGHSMRSLSIFNSIFMSTVDVWLKNE
jgi:hypothetical protein